MTFGIGSALNWNTCIGISNGNYMFRSMTENRKRSREDETCEFMPLSKRINNLHINNRELVNASSSDMPSSSQPNGVVLENCISTPQQVSSNSEDIPTYDPGLSSSQSHYYFENKLLFQLHLERIQRSGQQFPF